MACAPHQGEEGSKVEGRGAVERLIVQHLRNWAARVSTQQPMWVQVYVQAVEYRQQGIGQSFTSHMLSWHVPGALCRDLENRGQYLLQYT